MAKKAQKTEANVNAVNEKANEMKKANVFGLKPKTQTYRGFTFSSLDDIADLITFLGFPPAIVSATELKIKKYKVTFGDTIIMLGEKVVNVTDDLSKYDILK